MCVYPETETLPQGFAARLWICDCLLVFLYLYNEIKQFMPSLVTKLSFCYSFV